MKEKDYKERVCDVLDKYLEKVYEGATILEREEIRYVQREISKALDFYQRELLDNLPF